jgi:hypothetical protein
LTIVFIPVEEEEEEEKEDGKHADLRVLVSF